MNRKKLRCPLCKKCLVSDYFDKNIYYCYKYVKWDDNHVAHYELYINNRNEIRHLITIPPYRIVCFDDYSIIQQPNKNDDFDILELDTRILNIEPISPMSEKELLNRIKTILVFS